MAQPTAFPLMEHNILKSNTTRYHIMEFTGEGCFGKVAKCVDLTTNEVVTIKILEGYNGHVIARETETLQALSSLDPDKVNIVGFRESFSYLNVYCWVFEMLDKSVWDLLCEKSRKGTLVSLNEIRPVIHQLLVACDALERLGIMHTDLSPETMMLVDHKRQPYKIRLIDFGLAIPETSAELGMNIQASAYRAPEVYLGAPLSTAVDMWGVGCVMAYMNFGDNVFPSDCPYNWMKSVIDMLGQPDQGTLSSGIYTHKYFKWEHGKTNAGWRLRTPEEYYAATGVIPQVTHLFLDWYKDLEHGVISGPIFEDPLELKDRWAFANLLKSCLNFNPLERITPREALRHSFFTMEHLADHVGTSVYADAAFYLMTVSRQSDLKESDDFINDHGNEKIGVDISNNTPVANFPNPPAASSQNENNENGSLIGCNLTTVTHSGNYEDIKNISDEPRRDKDLFTSSSSLPIHSSQEDIESKSPVSSSKEPSADISSSQRSSNTSVSADIHLAICDVSAEVEPSNSSAAGATDVTSTTGADNIKTVPDGARRKPFFRTVSKFMGRVKKKLN